MRRHYEDDDDDNRVRDGLTIAFGSEWDDLTSNDKALIVRDCTEDGGVSDLAEYRRNIGAGNLQKYALCQRIRFKAQAINPRVSVTFIKG